MGFVFIKANRAPASHAEEIADARFYDGLDADLAEWMAQQTAQEVRTAENLQTYEDSKDGPA